MEKEYKISWLKVIGIFVLIVVIIGVLFIIYPNKNKTNVVSNFANNISLMKEAGFLYFNESTLPKEIGEVSSVTLEELINNDLIDEFTDEYGNICDSEESYIKTTKTDNNEYSMKVILSCDTKTDYIVTTISDDTICKDCEKDIIDNKETVKKVSNTVYSKKLNDYVKNPVVNTNKVVTNKTNRPISEESITTKSYATITNIVNYNINYFNTCGYCISNNCMSSCLNAVYYSVNFDSNGGSYVGKQIVKKNERATYVTSYRSGYEFLGWYLDGEKYDFATPVTRKITLVAKWKKIEEEPIKNIYRVIFNSNGGTKIEAQEVVEYNKVLRPNDPIKECYDFVGWYSDKNLTKRYSFETPVTKDITLYAKWDYNGSCNEELEYLVQFNSNGGTKVASQRVLEYDKAYEPKEPIRDGYTFMGWYTTSSLKVKYNFNSPVTKDITLYAKWIKDEVKYNTYCKIEEDTYYSISHTTKRDLSGVYNYNWKIKFDQLYNIKDLEITDIGYLTGSMYTKAYNKYVVNSEISKVNGNSNYNVDLKSASVLRNYSLKSNNFNKSLSDPYYSGGSWYTNAMVTVKNYNNANPYYADNLGYSVYFVPFYFNIKYTNMNNCVEDLATNSNNYRNYEVVDTYYE